MNRHDRAPDTQPSPSEESRLREAHLREAKAVVHAARRNRRVVTSGAWDVDGARVIRVTAKHLAVCVLCLSACLLILGGLVAKRVREVEAACTDTGTVTTEAAYPDEPEVPPLRDSRDWIPAPRCLLTPDGEYVRDHTGALICGEVL